MPGNDDHDEMSAEDLAALEDYENSEEGEEAGQPMPETPAERWPSFSLRHGMEECRRTADSINNSLNRKTPWPSNSTCPENSLG